MRAMSLRYNPRHPFPEFRADFGRRGWSIFRTGNTHEAPTVHGVFCYSMPADCVPLHGAREHVSALPDRFRTVLSEVADDFDAHAKVCVKCAHARKNAIRRAESQ